jgi:hypothetical protein
MHVWHRLENFSPVSVHEGAGQQRIPAGVKREPTHLYDPASDFTVYKPELSLVSGPQLPSDHSKVMVSDCKALVTLKHKLRSSILLESLALPSMPHNSHRITFSPCITGCSAQSTAMV